MHVALIIAAGLAMMALGGTIVTWASGTDATVKTASVIIGLASAAAGIFLIVHITLWFTREGHSKVRAPGPVAGLDRDLVKFADNVTSRREP